MEKLFWHVANTIDSLNTPIHITAIGISHNIPTNQTTSLPMNCCPFPCPRTPPLPSFYHTRGGGQRQVSRIFVRLPLEQMPFFLFVPLTKIWASQILRNVILSQGPTLTLAWDTRSTMKKQTSYTKMKILVSRLKIKCLLSMKKLLEKGGLPV